jgi:hypothetical protein
MGHPHRCLRPRAILAGTILALSIFPWAASQSSLFGYDATPLSGAEVTALITDNHLQGGFRARQLRMAFFADGVIRGQYALMGSDDGKWFMEGDNYCHHWVRYFNGEKRCYRWYQNGEGYVLRNVDTFRITDIVGRINPGIPEGY